MNQAIKIPKKVENFLGKVEVKYELMGHRTVYTAFDKAATLRVKPEVIAKVLTIKTGRELALAAVGGDKNLSVEKLQKLLKTEKISFAKEKTIAESFKGIKPGAIPPFEDLWKMKIICDKKFLESKKIILSAGTYESSLAITPAVFKKLNPEMTIGNFSVARPNKTKVPNAKKTKADKKSPKPARKKTAAKTKFTKRACLRKKPSQPAKK